MNYADLVSERNFHQQVLDTQALLKSGEYELDVYQNGS